MFNSAADILSYDTKQCQALNAPFDPILGIGSPPYERFKFAIKELPTRYYPIAMKDIPLIKQLMRAKSIAEFLRKKKLPATSTNIQTIITTLIKLRIQHDFPFWAACFVCIKTKEGGTTKFYLNYPQRLLVEQLENMRLANQPIRMVILKARQWGGSTCTQMYMAWIQLVHREGLYSAIVAHLNSASRKIRAMYRKMLAEYPAELLNLSDVAPLSLSPFEGSNTDSIISQGGKIARDTVISIGSMQSPDSLRAGDIALVHYSEVGIWKETDGKSPEEVIQAISSSVLNIPLTMIVMESTAKGEGNMFYNEWQDAKKGLSGYYPMFIAWFAIEKYRKPFNSEQEREALAQWLWDNRNQVTAPNERSESGAYLFSLLSRGATLEAINWYIAARRSYRDHDRIASEFPSDDVEAFASSGNRVFNKTSIERLRNDCQPPIFIGDISGRMPTGAESLLDIRITPDSGGDLRIWEMPDTSFPHQHRYILACDVGGTSAKADYTDIIVLDRWWRSAGEGDVVVAEWHGHCPYAILAWKLAQLAKFYCNALLVVESNTLETRDIDTEGNHAAYILNEIANYYPNLYYREASPEDIRNAKPRKYGFHTNTLTKTLIIDHLNRVLDEHLYTEREAEALAEYNVYIRYDNGVLGASAKNHDDRVMARAIAHYVSNSMPTPSEINPDKFKIKSHNTGISTI